MTDLLAIVTTAGEDRELLERIEWLRPDRVTVLVEDGSEDWAEDDSPNGRALRDRIALLLRSIEERTGAAVVGLAGNRLQLKGWRFDSEVRGRTPLPV